MKLISQHTSLLIVLIAAGVFAQSGGDTAYFKVPNYAGGINVLFDSTDLPANQAIDIYNLIPEPPNALGVRHGYTVWDSVAFTAAQLKNAFIYQPYASTYRVVVACSNYVYIYPGLHSSEDTVKTWANFRMGFSGDSIHTVDTSKSIKLKGFDLWWAKLQPKDKIYFGSYENSICSVSSNYDTLAYLDTAAGFTTVAAGMNYTVKKWFNGKPRFKQYQDKLYITDSLGFALVYNDTDFQPLALVDTGVVDSAIALGDSISAYSAGQIVLTRGSGIVRGIGTHWSNSYDHMIIKAWVWGQDRSGVWRGENYVDSILNIVSDSNMIVSEGWQPAEIVTNPVICYYNIIYSSSYKCNTKAKFQITDNDTSRNWLDIVYSDEYLTNYFAATTGLGLPNYINLIYCNDKRTFQYSRYFNRDAGGSNINVNKPYFIFSKIPSRQPSVPDSIQAPRFNQVEFYYDQMFACGYDSIGGKRIHQNRVWYSESAMPYMIKWNYYFDLPDNTPIARLFTMQDRLYIATSSKIYSFSGKPYTFNTSSDASLQLVLSSNGIPDYDCFVKETEEIGYFLNANGLYKFNGVSALKIAHEVDPLFDKYRLSQKRLWFWDNVLYVSYPDSNITILLYKDLNYAAYTIGVGFTCFASLPFDTTLFMCGVKAKPGQLCAYPNNSYYDIASGASAAYAWRYRSPWWSFDNYADDKQLLKMSLPLSLGGAIYASVLADMDTTAVDTAIWDGTDVRVWQPSFSKATGQYFQIYLNGASGSNVILRGYRLAWAAGLNRKEP